MKEPEPVSPLGKLLSHAPLDELFQFLQSFALEFTLTRSKKGSRGYVWRCEIRGEGTFRWIGGSIKSPKGAVCDALERFLVGERRDFHFLVERGIAERGSHEHQEKEAVKREPAALEAPQD